MVARGFSGARIAAARERKNKSQIFFERKKIPARARVLGVPNNRAREVSRARVRANSDDMLCEVSIANVPFFVGAIFQTNVCSFSDKFVKLSVQTLGFFFCLLGGAREQR